MWPFKKRDRYGELLEHINQVKKITDEAFDKLTLSCHDNHRSIDRVRSEVLGRLSRVEVALDDEIEAKLKEKRKRGDS